MELFPVPESPINKILRMISELSSGIVAVVVFSISPSKSGVAKVSLSKS